MIIMFHDDHDDDNDDALYKFDKALILRKNNDEEMRKNKWT